MSGAERERLLEVPKGRSPWRRWGPYLSERAWGTVREDYSATGEAWDFFPHDHARSRVYRWNEDGLAGISDDRQWLCFALAFWNGRDPILKERIFGLAGPEGNHGEDAKEYWWFLDSTPTHSWMRWRYMYPQAEFPYGELVEENRQRGKDQPEYELVDTGVFDEGRYWWSWGLDPRRPSIRVEDRALVAEHHDLGVRTLSASGSPDVLVCENETNTQRLFEPKGRRRIRRTGSTIVRCPQCGQVLMRIVQSARETWLDLRGLATLRIGET